ncbi:MAG: 16S rRNA (guanine(527)-N(7))-methyltransferase RsmG [Ignavibacteriales bacterium CG18_big_fil_WC_8_21_14_2_50_31_20]|nr:MAG: 16S rRNA (guanine(527)-N(7))-methyltransferase RsmG [Ignavibacteriales bacterium CG18_big_fil_WC_8_21_14_2_50_31_20]
MEKENQYLIELKKIFWENDIHPSEDQLERMARYAELLVGKNKIVNLISRKDEAKVIENHIFISAFVAGYMPERVTKFLDIGTGGGLPGIPFSIMNPLLRGVLVDSTKKKIDAVSEFVKTLKLSKIKAINSRVESPEFIEEYSQKFDLIVSRATVPLVILFRYALPLIKDRAYIMAIKGGDLTEEFRTAKIKYGSYIKRHTTFELAYKPSNLRNANEKKLVLMELIK